MNIVLAIDPSGSGSTGVCIVNEEISGNTFSFIEFKNSNWEEHLLFLFQLVDTHKPSVIIYETTNYIKHKMQSSLDLFKLIGAIASLRLFFKFVETSSSIAVNQVKAYKHKIQEKKAIVTGLICEPGRGKGWNFQGQRISLHQLDALIVFFLWRKRKKNSEPF